VLDGRGADFMLLRPRSLAALSAAPSFRPAPLIDPPRFWVAAETSGRLPVVFG
jgi:hypothetical protein